MKEQHPSIYKDYSSPENSDPFTTPTKKKSPDSEWTGSTNDGESDVDSNTAAEWRPRRSQIPFQLYTKIKELFYSSGPHQVFINEKDGKKAIVRRGLDWDGNVVHDLLVTDSGRFFVKYDEKDPGAVVEVVPRLDNRSVNIHGGKLRCAALVYRTFVKEAPPLPLRRYQFRAKNGNGLDLRVDNIVLAPHNTRKPRNTYSSTESAK